MLSSVVFPLDQDDFVIKSRLFKSMGKETDQESDVVISIFSVPVLIPFHPSYIQLEKISIYRLKRELQKIYKIEDIDHIASGIMLWDGRKSQVQGLVLVKEASYPMLISPSLLDEGNFNLRVQVAPPREALNNRHPEESLLDTEMVMRAGTPYVLGFPSDGNRYFLSISIVKKETGQFQEGEYSQASPEQDIPKTPTPVHKVIPAHPQTCKQDNIGGKVILQVSIDKQGNVTNVKILNSPHPDLSRAAKDAIQQWKFQPVMKKKKPISVTFPVIVDFKPKAYPSGEEKKK
jgi:TonB family protein